MTDYEKQGQDFLNKTKATMEVNFNRQGKYFDGDKEERDIYDITLARGERSYTFQFGQSIAHSGRFIVYDNQARGMSPGTESPDKPGVYRQPRDDYAGQRKWGKNKEFQAPTAYSVLAGLTKSDPGSLENFCAECGYDTDSRSAEKIYHVVKDEYANLCRLFSDKELELMQEIA